MIAVALWDFAIFVVIGAVAGGAFVAYKISKPIIRKIKKQREISKQRRIDRQLEQQSEAQLHQTLGNQQQFSAQNILHTTENYDHAITGNAEYLDLIGKEGDISEKLEAYGEENKPKTRKLYRVKKRIASVLKSERHEELQPDYVKQDGFKYDKTTYIQLGDERKAEEFQKIAENDDTKGIPYVYTIAFNQASGRQSLRVSTPSEEVFTKGQNLILQQAIEELSEISDDEELNQCFPITEIRRYGAQKQINIYRDELEFAKRVMPEKFQDLGATL